MLPMTSSSRRCSLSPCRPSCFPDYRLERIVIGRRQRAEGDTSRGHHRYYAPTAGASAAMEFRARLEGIQLCRNPHCLKANRRCTHALCFSPSIDVDMVSFNPSNSGRMKCWQSSVVLALGMFSAMVGCTFGPRSLSNSRIRVATLPRKLELDIQCRDWRSSRPASNLRC